MRVLAISGSLRRGSYNTQLLRNAGELVPAGVELELYAGLESVPPYNEDLDTEPAPAAVASLRRAIGAADAVVIATPEHNASVPGQLKSAIDWASRPVRSGSALWAKPVAVIGASTGMYGAVWAQADLRKILGTAGARVVDVEVAVSRAAERFDADGRLVGVELRAELREAIDTLVAAAEPKLVAA
jgi:chromate reductase